MNTTSRPAQMRTTFHGDLDADLQDLTRMITEMGGLAERQIAHAFDAIAQRNTQLAHQTINLDTTLDGFQTEIETKSVDIIAQRQPPVDDVRQPISALHISNDLERIGDLAKNISKRALVIGKEILPASLIHGLDHKTRLVIQQFKTALDSYAARDISAVLLVRNGDLQIDALNNALFHDALVYMSEDPHNIVICTQILFCIKNLERIGDHATNIAEAVYYMVSGHLPENERPKGDNTRFSASVHS